MARKKKGRSVGVVLSELISEVRKTAERALNESMDILEAQARAMAEEIKAEAAVLEKRRAGRPRKDAAAAKTGKRGGRKPVNKSCSVPDCGRKHYAKGLCASHYQQARKKQNEAPPAEAPVAQ